MNPTPPVNAHRLNPVDGWLRRLSLRLLPPHCLLCQAPGAEGRELCSACARDLPWNHVYCPRCALPLATPGAACGDCQQHPPVLDRLIAPFRYVYPLDGLVQRFKFQHDLAAGALLADLVCETLKATFAAGTTRPELILPVPLHTRRLRERGYNQSLELAKRIAPALGLSIDAEALHRSRPTAAQAQLDAAARRRNVEGAFFAIADRVRDRDFVLVDDVATTAATLNECARTLKQAGARTVCAWVIARAP